MSMKVKKAELLRCLKADLKAAEPLKNEQDALITKWKNEYNGEPYGNEQKGKSAIVSRDIKKQSEWQHATLVDPFVSTTDIIKCTPITWEDEKAATQNQLLLNTQFCRKFDRFNFMSKAVKVLDREGSLVVQTGWEYEDEDVTTIAEIVVKDELGVEYIKKAEVTKTVVKKNQPTAKVCRNEDIYVDPTCQDNLDNAQFIIYRYETDISTLKLDGRYKNLDKVAKRDDDDYDYDSPDDTEFKFADEPRKKRVVYEYWGNYDVDCDGIAEPIVCAWIGDVIIRLQTNPYPDAKPPFIVVPFNSVPFQLHGEANAEMIGDNQKVKTAIVRGIIDNMAQSNNSQVAMRKGALDPVNRKKFINGQNFEFNGTQQDFWQGSYNQIPSSAFDMIGLMNNEIESITGTKSFSKGITGSSFGNMLDIETNIPLLSGGSKKLKDVVDGDVLVGSDGKGTTVTKAHEIKYPKKAYNIEFANGDTIKSGVEHLWTVRVDTDSKKGKWHTVDTATLKEYYDKFYSDSRTSARRRGVYVPKLQRVDNGKPWDKYIDPYLLGYWLGDGNTNEAKITTEDKEIVEYYQQFGYELKAEKATGNAFVYRVNTGSAAESFYASLKAIGLASRQKRVVKHIPSLYSLSGTTPS